MGITVARALVMSLRIPRSGWILFALVPAACGGGSPGPQGSGGFSSGAAAPAPTFDPGTSSGGSSGGGGGSPSPLEGNVSSGTPAGSGTSTPAGSGSTGSPAGSGPMPSTGTTTDAFKGAPPFTSMVGNSAHHPGESCSSSNCHGPAGGETEFVVGGTVYKDYKGTTPAPGVEVRVVDAVGTAMSVYTGTNGNFYLNAGRRDGGGAVTYPVTVGVRDGTTTRPMVTAITSAAMGSCASAGCHIVGGSPASGAYYPIHVP
jgi:hypothetical protein